MLIKKNFLIFIHIPKNAGTMLDMMLADLFLLNSSENTLKKDVDYQHIYNRKDPELDKLWNAYIRGDNTIYKAKIKHYAGHLIKSRAHKNIDYYSKQFSVHKDNLSRYFSFCFVRNPYVRIISMYKFMTRSELKDVSFQDYILKGYFKDPRRSITHFTLRQRDFVILANGQVAVNFIGKIENFENDLVELLLRLDFPVEKSSKIAQEYTQNKVNYTKLDNSLDYIKSYYNKPEIVKEVYQYYKCDFELFKYSPDLDQVFESGESLYELCTPEIINTIKENRNILPFKKKKTAKLQKKTVSNKAKIAKTKASDRAKAVAKARAKAKARARARARARGKLKPTVTIKDYN